jgi:hypothetical protein
VVDAVSAAGVASAIAQGQVTTSTDTATHSACAGCSHSQTAKVAAAANSTAATKRPASRSACATAAGFSLMARSSRRTMACTVVSAPTRATRTSSGLCRSSEPPVDGSAGGLGHRHRFAAEQALVGG